MKGLQNLGNTCYFNTAIQCLLQVPQLSNFMIMKKISVPCEFTLEYQKLVKQMWLNKTRCHENPQKLFNIFKKLYKQFNNTDQQDSHEMIMCFLDTLDKSLRPFKPVYFPGPPEEHSLVREIFYGKILQEVVTPQGKNKNFEDTTCLMMFLTNDTTLEKCLTEYTKWNFLDNYKDDSGNHQQVTTTRHVFWYTPYILIISFKMYTGKFKIKLPEIFDVTPWIHPESPHKKNIQYRLFGTCTHSGSTHGGHYVSHVLHHNVWYMKDDSIVQQCGPPLDGYHYVVFYKSI